MLTEPRIGAVCVTHYAADGKPRRFIITEATPSGGRWMCDVVSVQTQEMLRGREFDPARDDPTLVTFEPLADGEEVLFFQAMLAPETLKEKL